MQLEIEKTHFEQNSGIDESSNDSSRQFVGKPSVICSDLSENRYLPAHILQRTKLLSSCFPLDRFQTFLEQPALAIAQDLIDIDFEISLDTWLLIDEHNKESLNILLSDPRFCQRVQQKFLLLIVGLDKIRESDIPFFCKIFHLEFDIDTTKEFFLRLLKAIDIGYVLSLRKDIKIKMLKLMPDNTKSEAFIEVINILNESGFFVDFSDHEMESFCNKLPIYSDNFKLYCGMKTQERARYGDYTEVDMPIFKTQAGADYFIKNLHDSIKFIFGVNVFNSIASFSAEAAIKVLTCDVKKKDISSLEIVNLAKTDIDFAVNLMMNLGNIKTKTIPASHIVRTIGKQKPKDLMRFIPDKITDFNGIDENLLWYIARLIVTGIVDGDVEALYQIAKRFDTGDYNTMKCVNSYLAVAYEARHLAAGLCLADHFWRGVGLFPSRELAIAIYQDIALHDSTILSMDAISRLSQHSILQAYQCYEEYLEIRDQLHTLSSVTIPDAPKEATIDTIKAAFGNTRTGFFAKHKLNLVKNREELQANAKVKLDEALKQLEYIINIDTTNRPELKDHLGVLTAQMLLFQIVTEQKESFSEKQFSKSCEQALRAAWDFDGVLNADAMLKAYLDGYKRMPRGNVETIIGSIKLEKQLEKRPRAQFFAATDTLEQKPAITRSNSLPNLYSQHTLENAKLELDL